MITFIFVLTPEAGDAAEERMLTELYAAFPEHEFLLGEPDSIPFENSILVVHGSVGNSDDLGIVRSLNPADVEEVKAVFRRLLDDLRGWKPS